ncbi:polyprenyl synthetase family protein [Candidatus Gottesmanbacteria bacterium]|nr:polyprenyl synthetase family protein [Candidatus Gottesmanbacteria bacterium]
MQDLFATYRRTIEQALEKFLRKKQRELAYVNLWGSDVCTRMRSFALSGKMIRGCLTILGYEMFGKKTSHEIIKAASAMEILQSSLLIHDDIMDRDTLRRGMDTIFTQYEKLGKQQNVPDSRHFGESMGICAGDIGFFFAFELLSDTPAILSLVVKELTKVGVAQMQDVSIGHERTEPSETALLNLYRYKTARYTFSLPLMVGATLAGQPKKIIKTLETVGEDLGIIFQLVDDTLDVEGDLREGKKTLLQFYGEKRTTKKISDLSKHTEHLIAELPIDKQFTRILLELLEYNQKRSK